MNVKNNFEIGDEVLFKRKDGQWRQGVIAELNERAAVVSWSEYRASTSHLSSVLLENIRKIEKPNNNTLKINQHGRS